MCHEKCFADHGDWCSALDQMLCQINLACTFYKSVDEATINNARSNKRLRDKGLEAITYYDKQGVGHMKAQPIMSE